MRHSGKLFPRQCLPYPSGTLHTYPARSQLIATSGDNELAVWAEANRSWSCPIGESTDFSARLRLPDANGIVIARRGDMFPIRAKDNRSDIRIMSQVSKFLTGCHLPHTSSFVGTADCKIFPIGRQGDGYYSPTRGDVSNFFARLHIPYAGNAIIAP